MAQTKLRHAQVNFTGLAYTVDTFTEQSSDPATPAAGEWKMYFKNSGFYVIDDVGTIFNLAPDNGWLERSETWTRTGNHTFTVTTDLTANYRKGTKVRYKDGGSYEYGVVLSSSYSNPTTTVNLIPTTDFAMAAATITDKYISYIENPEAWPGAFNYTPVFSGTGGGTPGSITSISAAWGLAGSKTLKVDVSFVITTFAPATGSIAYSLPATSATTTVGNGRENAVVGSMLQLYAGASSASAALFTYANGAVATNGWNPLTSIFVQF